MYAIKQKIKKTVSTVMVGGQQLEVRLSSSARTSGTGETSINQPLTRPTRLRFLALFLNFVVTMFAITGPLNLSSYQISQIYNIQPGQILQQTLIFYGVGAIIAFLFSIKLTDQYKCKIAVLIPATILWISVIILLISVYLTESSPFLFYTAMLIMSVSGCMSSAAPTIIPSTVISIYKRHLLIL